MIQKNVVLIDRGNHWEVIGDYSGSPRHASLKPDQWVREYENDLSYRAMRASQPAAIAATAPRGAGRWKKDWSVRYVPSA